MSGEGRRIGIAGLGTVGSSLINFLAERPTFSPTGQPVRVTGVSARDRAKPRPADISDCAWFDDPVALASSPDVDLFVELIGGAEGPAKDSVAAALRLGKPVVTANKALIATHGASLAAVAEGTGAALLFEAAVMGGAPAVKMLREAMVGDEVDLVAGILNGTCNYILSEMEASGREFGEVLAEAQRLGYAEADPTMDIGGFDAGHKISILAALAFGCAPTFDAAEVEGIERVELLDLRLAKDLGYRVKLVATASRVGGDISVRVHPALIPLDHPLARTGGALNALFIEGRRIGRLFVQGPGAGGGPTAAAVAADIADVLTRPVRPVFQSPASTLRPFTPVDTSHVLGRYYLRLIVRDQPGVIAAVSETLGGAGVSIDSFLQKPVEGAGGVPIVLTTHAVIESVLSEAVRRMTALPALLEPPRLIRIPRI
ncbi:MAG TPA: homoserine dehydrogenase [Caulobacteraceae bacterium]|nr:homoserine dehydrogenase [Caulobacteraceae bacterium]